MKHINRFAVLLKRLGLLLLTLLVIVGALFVYTELIPNVWYGRHIALSLVGLWLITAYIMLPRIHRFLSRIYLPAYFVGRTRTADGLLGDPVNLAINGTKTGLIAAMEAAGWQQADQLTLKSGFRIAYSSVLRRSYANAPVSDLYLFGRKQDLVFQVQEGGNPRKRHHVRFWRVPTGWYLPGGYKVDWIGAATYDNAVGISLFTGQITHSIAANVDTERNFLIDSLQQAKQLKSSTRIAHYFDGYSARNGGGHHIVTDGSLVVADLHGKLARTEDSSQHANLDSIQQEIYNLAVAKSFPIAKTDAEFLISRIEQELKELRAAHKTGGRTAKVAEEAVDVLIQTVQLIAALDQNTGEVYRAKMDKNWQRTWPKDAKRRSQYHG